MTTLKKWIAVSFLIYSGVTCAKGMDAMRSKDMIGVDPASQSRTMPDDLVLDTSTTSNDSLDAVCESHYKNKNMMITPL